MWKGGYPICGVDDDYGVDGKNAPIILISMPELTACSFGDENIIVISVGNVGFDYETILVDNNFGPSSKEGSVWRHKILF